MHNPDSHAFQEGTALGRLSAQGDRQIHLLEMLYEQGEELPERIAERMQRPESQNGITIKLRDLPGILLGLFAILAALNGKLSLTDAMQIVGKAGGGP